MVIKQSMVNINRLRQLFVYTASCIEKCSTSDPYKRFAFKRNQLLPMPRHLSGKTLSKYLILQDYSRTNGILRVQYVIKGYEKMGKCLNKPRKGRPKIVTARECRNIIHEATINPSSSAWQLVEKVEMTSQKSVSVTTVKRVLNQADL
uniref:Transposase Tc1-like domain-containing protein n=1 Tax=Rhodnius prolixus TaxID=13249 RepID=T1HA64_RHOPR